MGKVLKVYADGDLRVQLDGHAWTLHPQCVRIVPGSAAELANTMHAVQNQRQDPSSKYTYLYIGKCVPSVSDSVSKQSFTFESYLNEFILTRFACVRQFADGY